MKNHNAQHFTNRSINIVFVEDNEMIRKCMKLLFMNTKCNLICFENADSALMYIQQNPHTTDLLISDVNLGNTSGLELIFKIKSNNDLKHILTILQTSEPYDKNKSGFSEADGYIQKPCSRDALFEVIDTVLSKTYATTS